DVRDPCGTIAIRAIDDHVSVCTQTGRSEQKLNCYVFATIIRRAERIGLTFARKRVKDPAMLKTSFGLLSALCLVAGCAAPQPAATSSAATGSSATGSGAGSSARSSGAVASSSVDTPMKDDQEYETVFVPPPVGSLLGGGTVRVPKKSTGN